MAVSVYLELLHICVIQVYAITIFTPTKCIHEFRAWAAGSFSEIVLLSHQNVTSAASLGNRECLDNMSGSVSDSPNPGLNPSLDSMRFSLDSLYELMSLSVLVHIVYFLHIVVFVCLFCFVFCFLNLKMLL